MKNYMSKPLPKIARKLAFSLAFAVLFSCSSQKSGSVTPADTGLYEILTQQSDGGGNIRFYEVLTTEQEVSVLANDELLSRRVSPSEAKTATFLVLNMGEQPSGGYSIAIESVVEIPERIIVTTKDITPQPGSMNTMAITYPYTVVKINSKKAVEVK